MKQTTRSLVAALAFVAAAAAAGLGALYVNRDEARKVAAKEKRAKLFELDRGRVRELRVAPAGKEAVVLKRAGSSPWTFAAPAQLSGAAADEAAAGALLDRLQSLQQKDEVAGMDAKAAGLDAPRWEISFADEAGARHALRLGEENGFDSTVYARRDDDPTVRTLAAADATPLQKGVFDLRDKRVAGLDAAADVRRIEVLGTQHPYVLEKQGTGWTLSAPAGRSAAPRGAAVKADAGAAEAVIATLRNLQATAVAAETSDAAALRAQGLSPAKVAVRLSVVQAGAKEPSQRTVLIGQPPKAAGSVTVKTTARREGAPAIFEVPAQVLKDLDKAPFELKDKSVLSFDREQVRRIEIAAPGAPALSLARRKDAPPDGGTAQERFDLLAPRQGPARAWRISGALYSLSVLRAAAEGQPAPRDARARARLGLDRPRTVALFGEGDKLLARVALGGPAGDGRRWALAEGASEAVPVPDSALADLPATADDALEPPPTAPADAGPPPQAAH